MRCFVCSLVAVSMIAGAAPLEAQEPGEPIDSLMGVDSPRPDEPAAEAEAAPVRSLSALRAEVEAFEAGSLPPLSSLEDIEALNTSIRERAATLLGLVEALNSHISRDDATASLAVMVLSARLYDALAHDIDGIEAPPELDAEAATHLDEALGGYVAQFSDQAARTYGLAVQLATSNDLDNEDSAHATARLEALAADAEPAADAPR